MKWFLFLSVLLVPASAEAQLFWKGGIEIRKGIFGECIRAPAGTNICQGPCGLKISGPYCSPCGPMQGCGTAHNHCGDNHCSPATAYATAPHGQSAQASVAPVFYEGYRRW